MQFFDIYGFCSFFGAPSVYIFVTLIAFLFRIGLFVALACKTSISKKQSRSLLSLLGILASAAVVDCLLITKVLQENGVINASRETTLLIISATWIINAFFHLCIAIFVESLLERQIKKSRWFTYARLGTFVCLLLCFLLSLVTFIPYYDPLNVLLRRAIYLFALITGIHAIIKSLLAIRNTELPRLLTRQVKILIGVFLVPQMVLKNLTYSPFTDGAIFNTYLFTNISIILLTAAMYYCTFRLMGLRFLNTRDHVTASRKFDFVRLMKDVISQLNSVANSAEFRHVTQQVFSKAFSLPDNSVRLILTQDKNYLVTDEQVQLLQTALAPNTPLAQLLERTKVITRDEIDFSAYYDQNPAYAQAAAFLRQFNADVFIPVYDRHLFLGCIIVNQGARQQKFYSGKEQDEMALFAGSLSSIISVVRNRNIDVLLAQKTSLEAEVYQRSREVGQYQESIRSFVRESHGHTVGILYYKYGNFTFSNQTAHELVTCDPNAQRGHPLTIQLRKIAQNTEKYLTTQHTTICLDNEQRLSVSAFPSLEKQSTIVVVSHPGIADILKLQSDLLNDPGQWNYLLYLETTEAGHRVRALIPGSSKTLLNFKINLLRAALSHRGVLLNVKAEDRAPVVELLHTTSQREKIITITLKEPEKELSVARELFGFAPVLGMPQEQPPLLERLDKIGTVYIENVHFLSKETQSHLAEFLRYGAYTTIRGEQRIPSSVRIICASAESLSERVEQGLFLPELLDELRSHNLTLPQPGKLDRQEFGELIHEYMQQLLQNHALKKILVLSEREINVLHNEKCATFYELKRRLNTLINAKVLEREIAKNSAPKKIDIETDERINQAILLGKHALQDRDLMEYLWKMFQNQSRIATLLGVNRSSVNRRFKQLNIGI